VSEPAEVSVGVSAPVWVVVRSRNDAWVMESTLQALHQQRLPCRVLVMDNASSDGTRQIAEGYADRLLDVPEGSYVPGRVLNQAMQEVDSELVVFLNSDCTPQHPEFLEELLRPFDDHRVAAVYGRQQPRPDCWPPYARDTLAMYPEGDAPAWRAAFSMASSAVRRSHWEQIRFREDLSYSEDIDWSQRLRQAGFQVAYAGRSRVMHSHNYTAAQFYKRMRGEGKAEAQMFKLSEWEASWLRYTLLPLLRACLRDWLYCLKRGEWSWLVRAPYYRLMGALGRRRGFLEGR